MTVINDRKIIFIIFIIGILLRILYLADYQKTDVFPILKDSDGYSYFKWAKNISSMDFRSNKAFMSWPLSAYFFGALFKISGDNVGFIYLVQSILGVLSCVLVYLVAKDIFNKKAAFIAALLCLWYGLFMFYETQLIYTALSIFLNLLFFLLLLRIQHNLNRKTLFLSGIFLGICAITQANVILPGVALVIWFLALSTKRLWTILYKFFYFSLGLSMVIGLVTLRNYIAEKDFVPIAGNMGINFYLGNNPESTGRFFCPALIEPTQKGIFRDSMIIAVMRTGKHLKTSEVSNFWFNQSMRFIKDKPLDYARLLLRKIFHLFSTEEFIHSQEYDRIAGKINIFKIMLLDLRLILPLCILGFFISLKNFKQTAPLYLILISFSISIIIFFVTTKYRIIMVPFMAMFAGFGLYSIADSVIKKEKLKLTLLIAALCLISISLSRNQKLLPSNSTYYEYSTKLGMVNKAVSYIDLQDYKSAARELNAIQPPTYYSIFCFGTMYYKMHDLALAESMFKESIKINPYFVDAYYNLGYVYYEERRLDEAKSILEKAVYMEPENYSTHFQLAKVYKAAGEFDKARAEFELVLNKINRWQTDEKKMVIDEIVQLNNIKKK